MTAPLVTVAGEALLDLVAAPGSRSFAAHPGGSPANVAVGLARLGTPAVLATQLGDDLPGRMVVDHVRASGVEVQLLPSRTTATSLALAALDEHGVASYDFRLAWDVTAPPAVPDGSRCLHTGSIAAALSPGAEVLDGMLAAQRRRGAVTISLDPNVRPSLMGAVERERTRVERQVGMSDVVKVSSEDLAWLYPGEPAASVASRWLRSGPALVVVTLGADGGYALSHAGEVTRPAPRVEVVDTVGAGDAFTAGLLDGLRRADLLGAGRRSILADLGPDALADLLDEAVTVAAVTCSRPGADPPTRAELDQL